jgi:hypothetical protein
MPNLLQSLQNYDLGHLHIIAELWGISLSAPDARQGRKNLAKEMLASHELAAEIVESLPAEAQQALSELLSYGGQIPWHLFSQHYGQIREMGPGKRDREQPYLTPTSTAERLWYLGVFARAFFDTPDGPREYAYIPEDLVPHLPEFLKSALPATPLSRPAAPAERAHPIPVNDQIIDHATSLLAARRMGLDTEVIEAYASKWPMSVEVLSSLLSSSGLLDESGIPVADPARIFLEKPRPEALLHLVSAWLDSDQHDDLRLIPHLEVEGEWKHHPSLARRSALSLLETLSTGTWWSLPAFISTVKAQRPDFLRPSGDYTSWYLKDRQTDQYLRGFEHWEQVEGAYLQYLITGPMHWLGLIELASPSQDSPPSVFRFSPWYAYLINKQPPPIPEIEETLSLNSQGYILIPRHVSCAVRYLVARFCEWLPLKRELYHYRLTPRSLQAAEEQGLKVRHLLTILERHSKSPLPPNVPKSLERWQEHGTQITFQQSVILRVNHPEVLKALLDSPAKRFLGIPLGPTAITVNSGALQKVMDILMQLGYLSQPSDDLFV